jgi:NAD(P)-dependent dehydrogenase (short-subunit alcohol dehydrogenase family)
MQQQRIWFITGCSTGFGRALTEAVLEQGEIVAATARNPKRLEDLVWCSNMALGEALPKALASWHCLGEQCWIRCVRSSRRGQRSRCATTV